MSDSKFKTLYNTSLAALDDLVDTWLRDGGWRVVNTGYSSYGFFVSIAKEEIINVEAQPDYKMLAEDLAKALKNLKTRVEMGSSNNPILRMIVEPLDAYNEGLKNK